MNKDRRNFLGGLAATPLALSLPGATSAKAATPSVKQRVARVQYSVNAYTFNDALRSGEMTLFDMMHFAADVGLDAVDLTGYYFKSYPDAPGNEELFDLKRYALELGLDISWTGIRTDFVTTDEAAHAQHIEMTKQWMIASSKLGAPIIRLFTGRLPVSGSERQQAYERLVASFKQCAAFGAETGVIAGLQNHHEFLFTAEQVLDMLKRVDSPWFHLILDIANFRSSDPYREVAMCAPHAKYWLLKDSVKPQGKLVPTDYKKIARIVQSSGYRGYLSLEPLLKGDAKTKVANMFDAFRVAYDEVSLT